MAIDDEAPVAEAEAEEVAQDVGEVAEVVDVEARETASDPLVPETVVARPVLDVGQHRVRFRGFLEPFLGGGLITALARIALASWGLPRFNAVALLLTAASIVFGLWIGRRPQRA